MNVSSPFYFLEIWKEIISNPFKGFSLVEPKSKILLPTILMLLLSLAGTLVVQPIMQSKAYQKAMLEVQYNTIEKNQGSPVSEEMKQAIADQMNSPITKNITLISTYAGPIIGYLIFYLFLFSLVLKIITAIAKEKVAYGHLFRILVFAGIVGIVQVLLKNVIALTGNWQSQLATVTSAGELGYAITAPVSLAALTTPASIGKMPYYLLDTFTDIFNWLSYVFIYAGLVSSAKIAKNKALIVTIIYAVLGIGFGGATIAFL